MNLTLVLAVLSGLLSPVVALVLQVLGVFE